jgi:sugar phosphate isomerase/epimerase
MNDIAVSCVHRREFLQAGLRGAAALLAAQPLLAWAADGNDPCAGFKLGLQSYSLRGFKVEKALEATKALGLKYWEAFPGHVPMTSVPKQIQEEKDLLKGSGVTLLGYGVLGFDANETKARQAFDYAKEMGIETLSANPAKDNKTFDLLDKLVEEYGINIAIHNHGPGALYDKIDDVVNAIKDHHERIGACVDTGHYLRSKENPVDALSRLKGRVYGVHLKDVKDAKVFTILGEGDLDVAGCLKVLKEQNYKHSLAIEYEENPSNPMPDLEVCLRNLRKTREMVCGS